MEKGYKYFKLALLGLFVCSDLVCQTGGRQIFQFLNASPGARISALGGMPVSWRSMDPASVYLNPSLLTPSMNGQFQFSNLSFFSDIKFGHFSYCKSFDSLGLNFQLGTQYAKYGNIERTDIYGNGLGSFKASETDIYLAASKVLNERIIVGLSINYLFSSLDQYSSNALCFNSGISYFNPEKKYGISILFKNAGFQLSPYINTKEPLPFEIQLAYAKRLKHLPLVYHLGFRNLEKWNIRYDDPALQNEGVLFGEVKSKNQFEKTLDQFLRHFVVGAEIIMGKKENFSIRLGYNHLRNRELSLSDYRSFAGLSFGFGLKIYKFYFDYSYASYHIAGGASQISIRTNIHSFLKNDM